MPILTALLDEHPRLLVVEPEFVSVLKATGRDLNTLSPVLRSAWDGRPLEDYLRTPYGQYAARGEAVAEKLSAWGEALFGVVFGDGPGRDAYVAARARHRDLAVVVRSASPPALALPWELLRDPERSEPLPLDGVGLCRSLPAAAAESFSVAGDRLRVLMVISRPAAAHDVGYRMVARPLLARLEAVAGQVELVVLPPPPSKPCTPP